MFHLPEKRGLNRLLQIAMMIAMASCFFMVIITILDVLSRHLLKQPIPGVIELNEVLMVAVVFLGLGFAQKEGAHIRAELFISRLSQKWRKRFESFALVLGLVFWTLLLIQSTSKAWESFLTKEYREGLIKFPIWPARWALAIGIGLLCLQLIKDIYLSWVSKKK